MEADDAERTQTTETQRDQNNEDAPKATIPNLAHGSIDS